MGIPSKQIGWSQESILLQAVSKQLERLAGIIAANSGGGGGGGSTNLGYIAHPADGIVTSSSGTNAILPLANGINAGLLSPADFTKLATVPSDANLLHKTGNEVKTGTLTVNSIIVAGGLVTQFLKANGTLDSTVYAIDAGLLHTTGNEVKTGTLTATSFIKSGGLATQFLKGDGSIDSNTYALASSSHNPVTIGTANGLSLAVQVLSLALASTATTGALSSTDWNTFNNKQNTIVNPITGTGTVGTIPKFGTASSLVDSLIRDNGANIAIGVSNTGARVTIDKATQVVGAFPVASGLVITDGASQVTGIEFGVSQFALAFIQARSVAAASTPFKLGLNPIGGNVLLGGGAAPTDDTINKLQVFGTAISTAWKIVGGTAGQYLMADGTVSTLSNIVSGIIAPTIVNGDVTHAPSGDAVFDALVLKADNATVIHTSGNEVKTGSLTVGSIIKSGGLANQFLKADGTIDTTVYGIDANLIHKTLDEIKTGSLTVNSIIRAGGLISQYLMADGSVSTLANIASGLIAPTIVDGDTTHAPDGNSVFDALSLKVSAVVPGANVSINNLDPQHPIISATPATSAGVFDRVYFTGQVASVATPVGPNHDTLRNGKGSVASLSLVSPAIAASTKVFFVSDMISAAQVTAGSLPIGNFTSFLSVLPSNAAALKRFTIEVFLCDNAGVIIPQAGPPSTDPAVFYAGKNTVVILDSGDLTLPASNTTISLSGYLASIVNVAVGQRFRYHISVARGAGGGAQTMTVNIGSTWNSYVEAPVPITTSTVINASLVAGATDTDALNSLLATAHAPITIGTPSGLSIAAQVLSLALASTSTVGALSAADWNVFNNKQAALSGTGLVRSTAGVISYDTTVYSIDADVVHKAGPESITGVKTWNPPVDQGAIAINLQHGVAVSPDAIFIAMNGSDGVGGGRSSGVLTQLNGTNNIAYWAEPMAGAIGNVGFYFKKNTGIVGNLFLQLYNQETFTSTFTVDDLGNLIGQQGYFNNYVQSDVYSGKNVGADMIFNTGAGDGNANMIFYTGTGDNEYMRLTAVGNLLIGTTTDLGGTYKLQVAGSIDASAGNISAMNLYSNNNVSGLYFTAEVSVVTSQIGSYSSGQPLYFDNSEPGGSFIFRTDGIPRFTITDIGNVSITGGLTVSFPSSFFDTVNVQGGFIAETIIQCAGIQNYETESDTYIRGGTTTGNILFDTAGLEKMRLTPAGNLGIGSPALQYRLDLGSPVLGVEDVYTGLNIQAADYGYLIEAGLRQTFGGEMKFSQNQAGIKTERVRFDINGNVGIGTPTPTSRLSVVPSVDHLPGGAPTLKIGESSNNDDFKLGLSFYYTGTSFVGKIQSTQSAVPGGITLNPEGGNVGVGVLDPLYTLDVAGPISFQGTLRHKGFAYDKVLETGYDGFNDTLKIYVSGAGPGDADPKMTFLTSGNVGVGTINPTSKFHVSEGNIAVSKVGVNTGLGKVLFQCVNSPKQWSIMTGIELNTESGFGIRNETDLINPLWITDEGRVGINNILPAEMLHVIGNILASGAITPSDKRLKKNIVPLVYGIDAVMSMNPVRYDKAWELGGEIKNSEFGFLAQDLAEIFTGDEIVKKPKDENELLNVNYNSIIPVLVKAMQEQQVQMARMQLEIDLLRGK